MKPLLMKNKVEEMNANDDSFLIYLITSYLLDRIGNWWTIVSPPIVKITHPRSKP